MQDIYQEERKIIDPIEIIIPTVPQYAEAMNFVAERTALELKEQILKIKKSRSPILLMLSGGSALTVLEHLNYEALNKRLFDQTTTICVLDERFDKTEEGNNWLQIKKTKFYQTAKKQDAIFIETVPLQKKDLQDNIVEETFAEFTERFEKSIENWMKNNPKGKIVATIGIGKEDKHIAGMIPGKSEEEFTKNFVNTQKLFTAHEIGIEDNKFTTRVTPTMKFLTEKIDYPFVFAVDKEKEVKETFLTEEKHKDKYFLAPSLIIWKMKAPKLYTNTSL